MAMEGLKGTFYADGANADMPKRPGDISLDYVDYEDGLFDNTTRGLNEIEKLKNYYYLYICNKQSFYLFQAIPFLV